jgi:hypothetical protein
VRRHPEQVAWSATCLVLWLRGEGIRLGPDGTQRMPGAELLEGCSRSSAGACGPASRPSAGRSGTASRRAG